MVQLHPAVEPLVAGRPDERRVVAVAHRQQPAGAKHAAHLGERGDRVAEVLQHLMGVDDVERAAGGVDGVGVAAGER